jgi:hypothetical protein
MISLVWLLLCLVVVPTTLAASNCSVVPTSIEPIKVIVPLYVYPGSAWDEVLNAANGGVQIVAIVNPNSGPEPNGPDSSYTTYMKKLSGAAGITLIAYVHTSYGDRSLTDVENDIAIYGTKYAGLGLKGIFLDEVSNSASEIGYYATLYNYITQKFGYSEVFINPGTSTVEEYLTVSTNIMIYEDTQAHLPKTTLPEWVLCANTTALKSGWQYRFSGIAYAASLAQVPSLIADFHALGVGYVYLTDGAAGCCTYNSLASYFTQEIADVHSLNI